MLYLYQGGDNISDYDEFFMVWLTKSKFLFLSLTRSFFRESVYKRLACFVKPFKKNDVIRTHKYSPNMNLKIKIIKMKIL